MGPEGMWVAMGAQFLYNSGLPVTFKELFKHKTNVSRLVKRYELSPKKGT
jgi:hypothetical protein